MYSFGGELIAAGRLSAPCSLTGEGEMAFPYEKKTTNSLILSRCSHMNTHTSHTVYTVHQGRCWSRLHKTLRHMESNTTFCKAPETSAHTERFFLIIFDDLIPYFS